MQDYLQLTFEQVDLKIFKNLSLAFSDMEKVVIRRAYSVPQTK